MPSAAERKLEKKIRDLEQDIKKMNKSSSEKKIRALEQKIKGMEKSSSSSSSSSRSKKNLKRVPRTEEAKERMGRQPVATSGSPEWEGVGRHDDRGQELLEEGVRVHVQPNPHAPQTPSEANKAWNAPGPGPDPGAGNFDPLWAIKQGVVRKGKSPKKKSNKNKKKKKKTVHKKKKRN